MKIIKLAIILFLFTACAEANSTDYSYIHKANLSRYKDKTVFNIITAENGRLLIIQFTDGTAAYIGSYKYPMKLYK
jgi:hypothetical protein